MDTSDPGIRFDAVGRCDYCQNFDSSIRPFWRNDDSRKPELLKIAAGIRAAGKGRDHDCIIGVSGGLDSSYAVYVAVKIMRLRPLLYHVDAGWNTAQAVSNIERLVDGLGLDLYTDVINWAEMADLQRAFLKARIPDQDLPQDIAFFSSLYRYARKHNIATVVTGANFSTECCREPLEWGGYPGIDQRLIMDIYRRFGSGKLASFPIVDILQYKILYRYVYRMKVVTPLNYIRFHKTEAERTLMAEFDWRPFQHKHHESRFTRFYEDFWLSGKFHFEKRRAHYSSLIQTGQMSRHDALRLLEQPIMDSVFLDREFDYVADKLGFLRSELWDLYTGDKRTFAEYKSKYTLISLGSNILRRFGSERRLFR